MMKIGLALSGGGIRATVFHLGVLARMAIENRLEDISFISTVSGGSLCIGLVFAANNGVWPSSREYCDQVYPKIRHLLTQFNLERMLFMRTTFTLKYLLHRQAKCLSALLVEFWGATGELCDLPEYPRWVINATCNETGKRWRFEKKRMGDYVFGESPNPKFPISDAIAASAGVPFAVGSLVVDTTKYHWEKQYGDEKRPITAKFNSVHLWDGALYDNLGVEAFAKRDDVCDYLLISDASSMLKEKKWSFFGRYKRIYDISSSQSQSVRSRMMVEKFLEGKAEGCYLKIGGTMERIFQDAKRHGEVEGLRSKCLSDKEAIVAKDFGLTLRNLKPTEFDLLFRHGYEVSACTMYAYSEKYFPFMTFDCWEQ